LWLEKKPQLIKGSLFIYTIDFCNKNVDREFSVHETYEISICHQKEFLKEFRLSVEKHVHQILQTCFQYEYKWPGDSNSSCNHYQLCLGIHVVHAFIPLFVLP